MSRGTGSKVMVSLRIDRETLEEIDRLMRTEGFRSRRELLVRAFEEFTELRTPKHDVIVVRARMPKAKVGEMDALIRLGDQRSWEGIVDKAVERYLGERMLHLRELPRVQEEAARAVERMRSGTISVEP